MKIIVMTIAILAGVGIAVAALAQQGTPASNQPTPGGPTAVAVATQSAAAGGTATASSASTATAAASATGAATTPTPSGATPTPSANRNFSVSLSPLNNSGVSGDGSVQVAGDKLNVDLHLKGLDPLKEHPQQLAGKPGGQAAACPDKSADTNGDGIVSAEEAQAKTGEAQLALDQTTFPVGSGQKPTLFANVYAVQASGLTTPMPGATQTSAAATLTPQTGGTATQEAQSTVVDIFATATAAAKHANTSGESAAQTAVAEGTPPPKVIVVDNDVIVVFGMKVNGSYDPTIPVACGQISAGGTGPGSGGAATATPTATPGEQGVASVTPPASPTP